MQSYGNWNGVNVPNVINVPVTFNLLIQGYMGFVAIQAGRRTGVIRLTNDNSSFFIEATKYFSILQVYEQVPVNKIVYNMPAGSYDLLMLTTPYVGVDNNARAFLSGTIFT